MYGGGAVRHRIGRTIYASIVPTLAAAVVRLRAMTMSVVKLGDCVSRQALGEWLERFANRLAFIGCRYVHLGHGLTDRDAGDDRPIRFLSSLGEQHDPWRAGDPVASKIGLTLRPFAWGARDETTVSEKHRAWLDTQRSHGIRVGIAVPVHDPVAGPAYLSFFGGAESDTAGILNDRGQELIVAAIDFHCRAKEVLPVDHRASAMLTDRELICLRQAASGATLAETAAALGIAARSVELHVRRAARKLGASNKIHAVALAVGTGLIRI